MLKPNQFVKIKWGSRNKNRLVSLGYEFTHIGDEVSVRVEHLSYGSPARIVYICDYCGAEETTTFMIYNRGHEYCKKDACKKCAHLKSRDAFLEKYGVTNPLQVKEFNDKQKETCLKKYGVEHALQNKELLDKKDNTCIERYGVSSVLLNEDIANKKRETCLQVYGCEIPSQNAEVQKKMQQTNLERHGVKYAGQIPGVYEKGCKTRLEKYGVEHLMQNAEFAKKARISIMKTLAEHGNIPTSKAQYAVYEMCKKVYGEEHVELNKVLSSLALDVVLDYNGKLIDIEYDGIYWHNDPQKDRKRDEFVKQHGYKILRIRGRKEPPTKELLIEAIEKFASNDHTFMSINVDDI